MDQKGEFRTTKTQTVWVEEVSTAATTYLGRSLQGHPADTQAALRKADCGSDTVAEAINPPRNSTASAAMRIRTGAIWIKRRPRN